MKYTSFRITRIRRITSFLDNNGTSETAHRRHELHRFACSGNSYECKSNASISKREMKLVKSSNEFSTNII